MPDRIEALKELERRGALPEKYKPLLREAERRGMGKTSISERAQKIREAFRAANEALDKSYAERHPIASEAAGYLMGTPFIGEASDEVLAGVKSAVSGTEYEDELRKARALQDEASVTSQIAGAVVPSIAGGAVLADKAPAIMSRLPQWAQIPASRAGRMAYGGITGAAAGGLEGASQGFFGGEGGLEERLENAALRGAIQTGTGGIAGTAAPLVMEGIENYIVRPFQRSGFNKAARQAGYSPDAAEMAADVLETDTVGGATVAGLRRSGDDAMMADYGPASREYVDALLNDPNNPARAAGRNAIEQRAAAAQARFTQGADDILGPVRGPRAITRDIAESTAGRRSETFNRALSQPIDYATPEGQAVEAALDRVHPSLMRKAIREANIDMQAEYGDPNMFRQIMANIGDDGTVAFTEMPNTMQVHHLKRALQNMAQETNAYGKLTPEARRASGLASRLRRTLGNANEAYNDAMQAGVERIGQDTALDLGYSIFNNRTTREEVAEQAGNMAPEQVQRAAQGVRARMDDIMARVKAVSSDPNVDAREVAQMLKDVSSRNVRDKMEILLGPETTQQFYNLVDQVSPAIELRTGIAINSKTAVRTAHQQRSRAISGADRQPGAAEQLFDIKPGSAVRTALGTPESVRQRMLADYLSGGTQIFTGLRGEDAVNALQVLSSLRSASDPVARRQAERMSQILALGLAGPATTRPGAALSQ